MTNGTDKRISSTTRNRYLLAAIAIVTLALVITVGGALAPTRMPEKTAKTDPSVRSQAYVTKAKDALASGEATRAAALAQQALALDPGNQAAKQVLSEAEEGSQAQGGDTDSGQDGPATEEPDDAVDPHEGFTEPVDDIQALLPEKFSGFAMASTISDEKSAMVSASPAEVSQGITRITWTVREMKSRKAAESFVRKTSKELYPKDARDVDVDDADSYVGTDGIRYASCSYVRGLYVFEVLVTADQVAPKDVESEAIRAAEAFADSP